MFYNFRDTSDRIMNVAPRIASLLAREGLLGRRVGLAVDWRAHSVGIRDRFLAGLPASSDLVVYDLGKVPTPCASQFAKAMGIPSVVITASHLEASFNGLKVFTEDGRPINADVERELIANVEADRSPLPIQRHRPLMMTPASSDFYFQSLNATRQRDKRRITWEVTRGTEEWIERFAPNDEIITAEHPDPEFRPKLDRDFVISIDGDGDKCAIYHHKRRISGQILIGAMTTELGATRVVVSEDLARSVEGYLLAKGVEVIRTPVGDQFVIQAMQRDDFGGEPNGHFILPHTLCPDGLHAGMIALRASEHYRHIPLDQMSGCVVTYPGIAERDLAFRLVAGEAHGSSLRFVRNQDWVYVRRSGWESSLVIQVEGRESEATLDLLLFRLGGRVTRRYCSVEA